MHDFRWPALVTLGAVVLMFVGLKIAWLNDLYGGKFPITISLGIIAAIIALGVFPQAALALINPSVATVQHYVSVSDPATGGTGS